MFYRPLPESKGFTLDELINDLSIKEVTNFQDWTIKNITDNSVKVEDASLFVAIKGFNVDGHQYIKQAIENGAVAIIGESQVQIDKNTTYIRVENSRKALAKLINRIYNYPSRKLRLIGVTGTVGKTTTTSMIDHITGQIVGKSSLIGTLYTKIDQDYFANPNKCTTPDIISLNNIFSEIKNREIDYVSMEVSSHALKLDRVFGLDYDIAVFTNLSYDHLEFHESIDDYLYSKKKLFTSLSEDKLAVFNLDNAYSKVLMEDIKASYYTYAIKNKDADIIAKDIKLTKRELTFDIHIQNQLINNYGKIIQPTSLSINLPLLGYHNIYNALAAFTATILLGFPINKIKEALESFKGIRRRMEVIYDQEFTIIDDYAHNPASLTANFKTIENFDYNKLIILHFLKGKRGIKANKINAYLMVKWADKLKTKKIITSLCEEEVIEKNQVLKEEELAFTKIIKDSGLEIINTNKLAEGINRALKYVENNDLLLLVGGPGLDKAAEIISKRIT
ncbi:Mur ligase family protein [Orenia marismortui]|uniref:UDP-N-acetylmuramoylalanyl-D-glutamate--2, 6-diaminopimelate ligase n=1 Tax=Orenia marismortui TaxID=46469 RepID=A0A4R8GYT3_9FIRM|nr:UDP-N-acetylmuramyl-tripeptide synthetase [Orenia marismortui]TDX51682.1 UDP-N-acetylmuramoylalanyl-D-glutamate--2,6-diaminopimelate ligase [Orenia marismortui]